MRHIVVGTAGHIDHGKSALVEALTGTHPDRLDEERRRGITIELGFADLPLGDEGVVSFVDVPGHERFVRHMVAGATGLDAVLLVVAADEGIKPQTREHLAIVSLLAIAHGLVAMTKADLVEPELREVASLEIREFLSGSFLARAPILPVSSRTGEGLDALRDGLRALLSTVPRRPATGVPRLPIDRAFVMKGFGAVVTGTLVSGTLREGDEVEVLPAGRRGRIRGLQVHGHGVGEAAAGRRVAVNLQGLGVDDVSRGDTLTVPGALRPTRRARVELRFLRAPGAEESSRHRNVQAHHGTSEEAARLRLERGGGEVRRAELAFRAPVVLVPGDRFILRQPAPLDTIAGGIVLDAHPARGRAAGEAAEHGDPLRDRLARAGLRGLEPDAAGAELGRSRGEMADGLERLVEAGEALRAGPVFVDTRAWGAAEAATLGALEGFHRDEPLRSGMTREALRRAAVPAMTPETFRLFVDGLIRKGSIRSAGDRIGLAAHHVALSPAEAASIASIEGAYRQAGLDPPDAAAVAPGDQGRRLVDLLVEQGRLVKIRDGRLFHAEALERLRAKVRDHRRISSTMDVATFKDLAGVTRKNAIPLLEQLDEERVTRRVGNVREILSESAAR